MRFCSACKLEPAPPSTPCRTSAAATLVMTSGRYASCDGSTAAKAPSGSPALESHGGKPSGSTSSPFEESEKVLRKTSRM